MPGGGIIEPNRLHHNLLSSQPLCFNLFALPAARAPDALAQALSEALSLRVDEVTAVRFEHRPALSEGFKTGSAFDCFIEYLSSGERCFIGIETKYAENLEDQAVSDNPGDRLRIGDRVLRRAVKWP